MSELDQVKVLALAHPKPQTVRVDQPLSKAADKMMRAKIHSVIVVNENGKPLGVVSSLDVVKTTFMGSDKAKDLPLSKLIEGQKLFFIYDEVTLRDALNLMIEKNVRSLPIMNFEEKLAGIITMSDIARFVKEKL